MRSVLQTLGTVQKDMDANIIAAYYYANNVSIQSLFPGFLLLMTAYRSLVNI
jgi:hypothetical protein